MVDNLGCIVFFIKNKRFLGKDAATAIDVLVSEYLTGCDFVDEFWLRLDCVTATVIKVPKFRTLACESKWALVLASLKEIFHNTQ